MASKDHKIREMISYLQPEFTKWGIDFTMDQTPKRHVILKFVHNGIPRMLTISGSTDNHARLRNRSILRQMLEGRR